MLKPGECNSFVYNQSGYRIESNYDGDGKCMLYLAKIGRVEIRVHRRLYDIAQVTVSKQAGRWYAVLACKVMRRKQCSIGYEKTAGIDVGVKNYAYDSAIVLTTPCFEHGTKAIAQGAEKSVKKNKGFAELQESSILAQAPEHEDSKQAQRFLAQSLKRLCKQI